MRIADLCGLGDGIFEISAEKGDFKLFGYPTASEPDVMVIESATKALIIVFEDKPGHWRSDGYLGQMVSELIMCHYHNHFGIEDINPPEQVFLLRCYQHYVSAYSMEADTDSLSKLCHDGVLKAGKKLKLLSDLEDPFGTLGYDLLDKEERTSIVLLIETIKQRCIARNIGSK